MKKRLLSVFLCVCLVLSLLPETARAAVPSGVTVENKWIFANGNAITLKQGTSADKTLIYLDSDLSNPISLTGPEGNTTDGYDLSSYRIYGGCYNTQSPAATVETTSVTMEGGKVDLIHGGGHGTSDVGAEPTSIVTGTASVTLKGGVTGSLYGGGRIGVKTGGTRVTINGGTVTGTVFAGHSNRGKITGNMMLTMTGGIVEGNMRIWVNNIDDPASSATAVISGGTVKGELISRATEKAALTVSGSAVIGTEGSSGTGLQYSGFQSVEIKDTPTVRFKPGSGAAAGDTVASATALTNLSLCGSQADKFELELNGGNVQLKAKAQAQAHTHAVSVNCETDSGTQVAFQPLPDMSTFQQGGHPLTGGSYYLAADATVNGSLTINGNVTLCLNGHTLTPSGGAEIVMGTYAAISVPQGSSLTVCDCGQLNGGKISLQISEALLGSRGHAAIGGAGDVTLYGCAVGTSKTSVGAADGLCNTGGAFTLHDSRISATHTTSGVNQSPFAAAIEGRGGTTVIHGGTLSATVTNGTAYPYDSSGAHGLRLFNGSTAYLLGNPTITTSNNTNTENQADVYVSSPEAQFWLSKDSERYGEAALTVWVSKSSYSNPGGGTVIRGVGKNGNVHTIKNAPNRFVGTVIDTEGRKDLVLTGPYQVTFNANGGQGTMADLAFDGWEDSKALTANGFTGANGAPFQGWNTKADGSGASYDDGATVSGLAYGGTVTLYAQWGAAQGHTHVWGTGWSSNSTHHWHECTAPGCDITDYANMDNQLAAHAGYGPHNKTWVNTDPAQHWHTCTTCGWTDTAANHVYDNDQDAECNTCGYTRTVTPPTPGHTHTWDADWSSNSTHHWHECTAAGCTITDYSTCGEAGAAYGAHTTQYTHNQWTHWQVCAVCGDFDQDRATEGEHVYDDDQDTTCNTCGYTRTVTPPTPTYGISGKVTDSSDNAVSGATVKLMQGKAEIAATSTDVSGDYSFTGVVPGLYNVVAGKDGVTKTIMVEITSQNAVDQTIKMPDGNKNSVVEVKDNTPAVVVGGVDAIADAEPVASGDTVTIKLTVEKQETPADKAEIDTAAQGKTVELYLDLSLIKTVLPATGNSTNTDITDTGDKVLAVVVPYDFTNKTGVTVYRKHGTENAAALSPLAAIPATPADGTFYADSANGRITIYATKFSTYAIGYTTDGGGNQPQPPSGGGDFSGGGGDFSGGYIPPTYAVDLPASTPGGKLSASPRSASGGATVTLTLTPEEGYEIGGVTVTDQNGKTVAVTDKGGGKYTFTMPNGKVSVKAEFTKSKGGYAGCPRDNSCPIWRFPDADPAAWYHDGVHYCVEHGLMSGYGGLFRPDDNLSRAEFVQVLHNLEGKPVVNYLMGFEDVPGGAWYAEAVRWAASRQIAGGYGNGRFGPNHGISREELAVMLWRYAGRPSAAGKKLNFTDAETASSWAAEALCWAVDQGILQGKDGGILDPKGMTTRAEAAAVLQRVFGREQ